jgi:tetratricopeptide (TPR) repeat protein
MMRNPVRFPLLPALAAAVLLAAAPALAQPGLTLPPDGENQFSSVTQGIGLVRVTIQYNSPDVHSPTGEDRRGKIWGTDVAHYGMANLGFGTCGEQCPWRGGSNENTVFTTSHDVKIQDQPLPAGSYGLFFVAGKDEWTIIFSKNHTSWGSYFYDPKEDALRVQAKPEKSAYNEWLTYEFIDRKPDSATVALKWEDLQVPFTISVDNIADLYLAQIRQELRSSPGFNWQNWAAAAQYALRNNKNLDEALAWAQHAATPSFSGQENFATLTTLADLQAANGKAEDARKTMDRAVNHPTAGPIEVHTYGRQLQARGKNEEAMRVFEMNAKKHPNVWPVHMGLARGHAGLGRTKEALAEARRALAQAPDDANRQGVEALIKQLESAGASR